jgi:hypothetical protein
MANGLSFLYIDFMVSALSVLLEEFALDGSFARFGLLATTPVIFCVSIVSILFAILLASNNLLLFHFYYSFSVYSSSVTSVLCMY